MSKENNVGESLASFGVVAVLLVGLASCEDTNGPAPPARDNSAQTTGGRNTGGTPSAVPGTGGTSAAPVVVTLSGTLDGGALVALGGGKHEWWRGPSTDALEAGVTIGLVPYEDACHAVRVDRAVALLVSVRGPTTELLPGSYPIVLSSVIGGSGAAPEGTAMLVALEAEVCSFYLLDQATAGTVTLASVTPARVEGTFALEFESAGSVTGTFGVPECPASPADLDSDPTLSCLL